MNTLELLTLLKQQPLKSCGVYPRDILRTKRIKSYPAAYIANTDPSGAPGTHWVAFYFPNINATPEFFDSFGQPPGYYSQDFVAFLSNNTRSSKWTYNTTQVQAVTSWQCGEHCIFYISSRCDGLLPNDIINKQYRYNNYKFNDELVRFNVVLENLIDDVTLKCNQCCRRIMK